MDEIPTPDQRLTGLRKIPRRVLTVSVATAALVVAGGAVLAAAAQNTNPTPSPTAAGRPAPDPMGQHGNHQRMAGPMQALHGEYVVSNGNEGYSTEEMQRGSVTAVSGNTFTVKSDDGYTHDWVLDANTRTGRNRANTTTSNGLTPGQNVMVMGTKDGDTFHAVRIMAKRQFNDQAAPQAGQQQSGDGPMMHGRGGRGQFGPRFGGGGGIQGFGDMPNGPMQSGPMQAPMPQDGTQSAPMPSAPDAAPTPTQSS